ncbi:glycoside hydrolase family 65 protein [Blautia schinkii]|nr:glycoside hydrolase family 65 protein [Blautia schinkii]
MTTCMDYSKAQEWILGEKRFDSKYLGKCEAVMCQGNGYMGIRSATEEHYLREKRDFFVAGTFNKFDENEVTELPNAADVLAMDMEFNGCVFSLEQGTVKDYYRQLNIRTGELTRTVTWVSPQGDEIAFTFERIVSMKELHTIAQRVQITPISGRVSLKLETGIDGSVTNSGSQHFSEGDKRFYDNTYMQCCQTTTQTKLDFVFTSGVTFTVEGKPAEVKKHIVMDRRKIFSEYTLELEPGKTLTVEKISNVFTSRDKENEGKTMKELQEISLEDLKRTSAIGYEALLRESAKAWDETVWSRMPVTIVSENPLDQLAIRFAQYHLYVMTPRHDNRMNIGAKGLSGEGYKGHTFWDTDIFALPYFTFTDPAAARSLEEYRYLSLPGAHKKAKSNNYEGAQFPWESAWLDDGEVTPVWGAADIITGLPTKIWSGFIEQHITADVAYGVWQYYMVTGDQDYMDKYGYELLMDTAKFWASRLEWSEEDKLYHINDVVGADEYKEHADDNAFTNYMAHWNLGIAMEYYQELKDKKPEKFKELDEKMGLQDSYKLWEERRPLIYLPQPREEDLVVAQDKHYLSYPIIDLTKYKESGEVGTLFREYNLEQVCHMQVSKQADIMALFFLMEDLFSLEVKKANWDYYEPKTLHDSSLSLSTHVILANDMRDKALAYKLFQRAVRIDAGENMKTSDAGIHAGSLAGIWQSVFYGFGGVRMLHGKLRICPLLPDEWQSLEFYFYWHGQRLHVQIDKENLTITNETGTEAVELNVYSENYQIKDSISVNYSRMI